MNVKKTHLSPTERADLSPQTLAHVIFFHIFFTQASTPSLLGPEIGFKHHDREAIVLIVAILKFVLRYRVYTN